MALNLNPHRPQELPLVVGLVTHMQLECSSRRAWSAPTSDEAIDNASHKKIMRVWRKPGALHKWRQLASSQPLLNISETFTKAPHTQRQLTSAVFGRKAGRSSFSHANDTRESIFGRPTCFNYVGKSQKIKKRFGNARRNLFEVSWVTGARGGGRVEKLLIWPSLVPKWHQRHTKIMRIFVLTEPPPPNVNVNNNTNSESNFIQICSSTSQQIATITRRNSTEHGRASLSEASDSGPCPSSLSPYNISGR